jgi:AAA family ATP:ADP antiporter
MTALLQRFIQVRRGEGAAVVASSLSFFFILTALMVIRPAREALGMQRGIEAVALALHRDGRRHARGQSGVSR